MEVKYQILHQMNLKRGQMEYGHLMEKVKNESDILPLSQKNYHIVA